MIPRAQAVFVVLCVGLLCGAVLLGMARSDVPELPTRLELDRYHHVNSLVVPDAESPIHGIHHFYVNDVGRVVFQDGGTDQYPDKTTFVGRVYAPMKTDDGRYREGDLVAYTLMRKASGDPATEETGGWHFVMYDAKGNDKGVDAAQDCFGCHEPSPQTDFVLSEPLER